MDDDRDLDPDNIDDLPADEPEDIDLGDLGGGSHAEPDDKPDEEDPKITAAKATARAAALEEEVARRDRAERERDNRQVQSESDRAVLRAADTPAKQSLADLVPDDFDAEFVQNPQSAMKKLFSAMDGEVDRRTRSAGAPAAVSQGMLVVDSFKARMREQDAEEFAVGIKHFNARVAEIRNTNPQAFALLVNMTPQQVDTQLGIEWDAAVGRGERENREQRKKEAQTRRAAPAPNFGGSSGRGGTVSRTAGGQGTGKLTEFEKDMVTRGKAAGLSDADCKEMVREHRAEQRRLA